MAAAANTDRTAQIWEILRSVPDPEIPVVNIVELGMVRAVDNDYVVLTTTYVGCPATDVIFSDVRAALSENGLAHVRIDITHSPAWTTDWIEDAAKEKLLAYGIAPPRAVGANDARPNCPRCGSGHTKLVSQFGSTPCKSHHKCQDCLEPFDAFKCH